MKQRYEYQKAAAKLRDQILSGELKPLQRLSGERDLCHELGVSRITVRLALDLLEKQNFVVRRHGSGTYVSNHPMANLPFGVDYSSRASAMRQEYRWELALQEWTTGAAAHKECPEFRAEEEVLHIKRVLKAGAVAICWDRGYLLKRFATRLTEVDLVDSDFINRWMRVEKFRVRKLSQTVSAMLAGREDAKILRVRAGTPIVRSVEVLREEQGGVAGVFQNHYHPEKVTLTNHYDWVLANRMLKEYRAREA